MEMRGGSEREEAVTLKRAEIDTTAPFRSVREAVTMFGDMPVGGQRPYPSKVKMGGINGKLLGGSVRNEDPWELDVETELDETKYRLRKAREESLVMENRLCSLRQELERTKTELQLLKHSTGAPDQPAAQKINNIIGGGDGDDDDDDDDGDDDIESVEILEDSAKMQGEEGRNNYYMQVREEDESSTSDHKVHMIMMNGKAEMASKRYHHHVHVNAAVSSSVLGEGMFVPQGRLERHPSLRRKKKRGLIPLIGAFFSKTYMTKTHTRAAHEIA